VRSRCLLSAPCSGADLSKIDHSETVAATATSSTIELAGHVCNWPNATDIVPQQNVGFSNRPFGVKRLQTIHHYGVDVAHGLVLLFGIGTKALVWGFFSQEV
jgi:hypothetical protein